MSITMMNELNTRHKHKGNKHGRKNKKRKKLYQAEYYLKNIDRLKQYKRNWYQETRKEVQ